MVANLSDQLLSHLTHTRWEVRESRAVIQGSLPPLVIAGVQGKSAGLLEKALLTEWKLLQPLSRSP